MAMHSLSSLMYPSVPMQHCAGAILLGAALDGSVGFVAGAAAAPRPLLHIFGAQDGQLRLPRAAWLAAALAPAAAQLGAR